MIPAAFTGAKHFINKTRVVHPLPGQLYWLQVVSGCDRRTSTVTVVADVVMEYTFKSFVVSARDRLVGGRRPMMAAFCLCLVSLPGCVHLASRETSEAIGDASPLEFPAPVRTLTPDNRYVQIPSASIAQRLQTHLPG